MGSSLTCLGCPSLSYSHKITKRIRLQRELAALYNDIFERRDRFLELCEKIEKLEKYLEVEDKKKTRLVSEERTKKDYEINMKKILEHRKELLLKVIDVGIAVQDRERQLIAIEQKYAKLWSLTYEDDPEDQLEEWKRDLRKTRSQSDMNKVVPRPPVVRLNHGIPVFFADYTARDSNIMALEKLTTSSNMDKLRFRQTAVNQIV